MAGAGRREFGVWLREQRVQAGLTQVELAAFLGRSGTWLGQVETGRSVAIDRSMGSDLDRALGLQPDTVFEQLVRLTFPDAAAMYDERIAEATAGTALPETVAKVTALIDEVASLTDDGAALAGLVRLVEVGRVREPIGGAGISPREALSRLLVHFAGMGRSARERLVVSAFFASSAIVSGLWQRDS